MLARHIIRTYPEYYEFFGKFFRGGGELYRPLMLKAAHNKEGGVS